jgi:hypothetical protein
MDEGRYDGIVTAFKRGDATVVGCTLDHLRQLVQEEDDRLAVLNPVQPSAKRSKLNAGTPQAPANPAPDKPPAFGNMEVSYPPTTGIRWGALKRLIEANKQCPLCFTANKFHRTVGCPALAQSGYVLIKDAAAAKKVSDEFQKAFPKDPTKRPGAPPGAAPKPPAACRATSKEQAPSGQPSNQPPPQAPPPPPLPAPPAVASENY